MVQHFAKNAKQSDNESRLLYELGLYLENCGLSEPVNQVSYKGFTTYGQKICETKIDYFFLILQIYMPVKPSPKLIELIFLCVIGHLSKGYYSPEIDHLLAKKIQDHEDNYAFLLGLLCLLKQYPDPITRGLIEYLAQYARSFIADYTNR